MSSIPDQNKTTSSIFSRPMTIAARELRAQRLEAALMQRIYPILDSCQEAAEMDLVRHVRRAISEVLLQEGIEVMTDYDRQEAGLPPRGPNGWTLEEMAALEKRRLEVMIAPKPLFIVEKPTP